MRYLIEPGWDEEGVNSLFGYNWPVEFEERRMARLFYTNDNQLAIAFDGGYEERCEVPSSYEDPDELLPGKVNFVVDEQGVRIPNVSSSNLKRKTDAKGGEKFRTRNRRGEEEVIELLDDDDFEVVQYFEYGSPYRSRYRPIRLHL